MFETRMMRASMALVTALYEDQVIKDGETVL